MERLLTPLEAAQLLNVKPGTVYAWAHRGQIPHVRIGVRCIRLKKEDIQQWIDEHTISGQRMSRKE